MTKWQLRLLLLGVLIGGLWLLSSSPASALTAEESCFTSKINGARSAAGKPALVTNNDLVAVARRHSQRMANSGSIYHNSNLAGEAPSGWRSLGENVGVGPSCDAIHNAFMNSASHKANILDSDFNQVGVGVVITGDGTIYVTEVFMEKPISSPTTTTTTEPKPQTTSTPKPKPAATSSPKPQPVAPPAPPPPPPPPPP
ncbi:MAG: CAP domain-containing protein, partial [Acidimicrobiia bacterium]